MPEGGDARWFLEPRGGDMVGPDVIAAVYVCLGEAAPMFGHLYGLGSFLASNPEEAWLHQSLWSSPRWPMWRERAEGADLVLKKDGEIS